MKYTSVLLILAISFLAACAPANTPDVTVVEPLPTETKIGPSETPPPLVSPTQDVEILMSSPSHEPSITPIATHPGGRKAVFPNTIIVFQREGNFPESPQKWTFYHTGLIVTGDGSEWKLQSRSVRPLFELVESPGFRQLSDNYLQDTDCDDSIRQALTVFIQGDVIEILTCQGDTGLPKSLIQIFENIDRLVSSTN